MHLLGCQYESARQLLEGFVLHRRISVLHPFSLAPGLLFGFHTTDPPAAPQSELCPQFSKSAVTELSGTLAPTMQPWSRHTSLLTAWLDGKCWCELTEQTAMKTLLVTKLNVSHKAAKGQRCKGKAIRLSGTVWFVPDLFLASVLSKEGSFLKEWSKVGHLENCLSKESCVFKTALTSIISSINTDCDKRWVLVLTVHIAFTAAKIFDFQGLLLFSHDKTATCCTFGFSSSAHLPLSCRKHPSSSEHMHSTRRGDLLVGC